jgi:hypothetical protein
MSRLTIDITDKQHQALKAMAALQGKTIKQFALEKLFSTDEERWSDDEKQAWAELSEMLNARIDAGIPAKRSFDRIVEETLKEVRSA